MKIKYDKDLMWKIVYYLMLFGFIVAGVFLINKSMNDDVFEDYLKIVYFGVGGICLLLALAMISEDAAEAVVMIILGIAFVMCLLQV